MASLPNMESVAGMIHPLDAFYAQAGLSVPPFSQVEPEEMPEPYKSLLAHRNDMTPTLEKFHQQSIHLRVLTRWQQADQYFRQVVLVLDESDEPVEFGAIKINLNLFQCWR